MLSATAQAAYLAGGEFTVQLLPVLWEPPVDLIPPVVQHIGRHQQQRALARIVGMEGVQEGNGLQ